MPLFWQYKLKILLKSALKESSDGSKIRIARRFCDENGEKNETLPVIRGYVSDITLQEG